MADVLVTIQPVSAAPRELKGVFAQSKRFACGYWMVPLVGWLNGLNVFV